MFAVIFIVQPKPGLTDKYLEFAKVLKPEIEQIDGFIDKERFGSRRDPSRIVSLSTWRDEKALVRWRTLAIHHAIQEKGRFEVFAHYHSQVGEITADTHVPAGHALRNQRLDETESGVAKAATLTELVPGDDEIPPGEDGGAALGLPGVGTHGLVDQEVFDSIYNPGKLLLHASWQTRAAADHWTPRAPASGSPRHRRVRVIREYGMAERREAPQYYPPVLSGDA